MTRIRQRVIPSANYVGDRAIVRFRNETQFNVKQADTAYGTTTLFGGNFFGEDVVIPTLPQWLALYTRFRVLRCSIAVTFTNIEATFSKDVGVTQLPLQVSTAPTPAPDIYLSEQPRTKSSYLTPLSGSFSRKRIFMTGTTGTAYGSNTAVTSDADKIPTSNPLLTPTNAWRWSVWTQNVSGAGTTETAGTNIRVITYHTVEFLERKVLTGA